LDKRDLKTGLAAWRMAIDAAPDRSSLRRALKIEGYNLGLPTDQADLFSRPEPARADDLVNLPWIDDLRLAAASGTLSDDIESRARGAWSFTMGFGQTRLDEAIAAEVQATWIGALWVRRGVRKQLGAQLLGGAAGTPEQWAYGMLMWALGGVHNPERALKIAEPHFDAEGADFVVKSLGEAVDSTHIATRLVSLAAEAWDLVSNDTLRWLVGRIPPQLGDVPPAPETRQIWTAYALRLTDEWARDYRKLDQDIRGALLDQLSPSAIGHFDTRTRGTIWSDAVASTEATDAWTMLPLLASLATEDSVDAVRELVDLHAPSHVVAALQGTYPSVVSANTAARALADLTEAVVLQNDEARRGKVGFGVSSVRIALGRLLASMSAVIDEQVEPLVATAVAEDLPSEYVLEARQGLLVLRRSQALSADFSHRLREARDVVSAAPTHGGLTEDVLRATRLAILAPAAVAAEKMVLLAAGRDGDARVRQVALMGCVEALEKDRDESLAWAVVSGLFDPADEVTVTALTGLTLITDGYPEAAAVAWARLPRLLDLAGRDVRVAVVDAAKRAMTAGTPFDSHMERVVTRARHDRSWRVRDLAGSESVS
jgi:hypothetical protein